MRGGSKTLAALVALLLLAGLAGCGGGDGSDSTAAQAGGGSGESTASGASKQDGANGGGEDQSGSGDDRQTPRPGDASEFKPKHHNDSGGGAEQFKVKGGDNSVQEFGAEANASDFEAAATALHNFLDARAQANWAAACQYMSKSIVESFDRPAAQSKQGGETSCGAILAGITNPNVQAALKAEAEKADVGSLRTEGDQAFLIYTGTQGTILAMPMADEAGAWKVSSLAGTPLN